MHVTVVVSKDSDIKSYIPKSSTIGTIITTVVDSRKNFETIQKFQDTYLFDAILNKQVRIRTVGYTTWRVEA